MKLETTLTDKPGMLHAFPLLDLLALVLIFPLLAPSFLSLSGAEVELPENDFRMQRVTNPMIVTVTSGIDPQVWVGKKRVENGNVMAALERQAENWKEGGKPVVLMKIDRNVPSGFSSELSNKLLRKGYRVMIAGKMRRE